MTACPSFANIACSVKLFTLLTNYATSFETPPLYTKQTRLPVLRQAAPYEVEDGSLYGLEAKGYQSAMEESWVWEELHECRNVKPAFEKGLYFGTLAAGVISEPVIGGPRGLGSVRPLGFTTGLRYAR